MDKTDEYITLGINKRGHYGKVITAAHVFDDMLNWKYDLYNGYANFKQCMDFILPRLVGSMSFKEHLQQLNLIILAMIHEHRFCKSFESLWS